MSESAESEYWDMKLRAAVQEFHNALDQTKPSYRLHPRLFIDGDKWCALYGENIQDGVAGFGTSPDDAYLDFDRAWMKRIV